jgi:hypothetical protein
MEEIISRPGKNLAELSTDEFLALLESATAEELKQISESPHLAIANTSRANILSVPLTVKATLSELLTVKGDLRAIQDILSWWEWRRPLYNVLVGVCGLPGLLCLLQKGWFFMLIPIVCYAIFANVCYTLGWNIELAARQLFGERARYYGPICFVLGTIFSMVLTIACSVAVILLF